MYCHKCSPETKLFTKYSRDTTQKDHIYHTKQYQTFSRKIKCDLLNFREVKKGYHQDFQYLMVSIHFFHKMEPLMINCNQEKKICSIFLMERPCNIERGGLS